MLHTELLRAKKKKVHKGTGLMTSTTIQFNKGFLESAKENIFNSLKLTKKHLCLRHPNGQLH